MRDADQFHVREHEAGALVPVVEQYLDAGGGQFLVQGLGRLPHPVGLVQFHGHQGDLEGGDGLRPANAALVVMLFDGGGHHSGDADAVTAHLQGQGAAGLVQDRGLEGLAVFLAELEDVADLDAAGDGEAALAVRAGVTLDHAAQVGDRWQGQVPAPVEAEPVLAVLIGPGAEIGGHRHGAVGDAGDGQAQGAEGAGTGADGGADLLLRRHPQGLGHLRELLGLDGIQLVVAPHQQGDEAGRA